MLPVHTGAMSHFHWAPRNRQGWADDLCIRNRNLPWDIKRCCILTTEWWFICCPWSQLQASQASEPCYKANLCWFFAWTCLLFLKSKEIVILSTSCGFHFSDILFYPVLFLASVMEYKWQDGCKFTCGNEPRPCHVSLWRSKVNMLARLASLLSGLLKSGSRALVRKPQSWVAWPLEVWPTTSRNTCSVLRVMRDKTSPSKQQSSWTSKSIYQVSFPEAD